MNLEHVILVNKTECPVIRTTDKAVYLWHYGQRAVLYRSRKLVTRNRLSGKFQAEEVK